MTLTIQEVASIAASASAAARNVEPNWFYSSLAQSMAAIAGILGGFIFTAVLRQRDEAADRKAILISRANEIRPHQRTVVSAYQTFATWFDTSEAALTVPVGTVTVPFKAVNLSGNAYDLRWETQAGDIDSIKEVRGRAQEVLDHFGVEDLQSLISAKKTKRQENVHQLKSWHQMNRDLANRWGPRTDEIASILNDANLDNFASALSSYYLYLEAAETSVNPGFIFRSLKQLSFLTVVGVLIPLVFLDAYQDATRWILLLLAVFAVGWLVQSVIDQVRANGELLRIKVADLDRPI